MDLIDKFRLRRMFRIDGRIDGGPGSGHHGHMGIPGKRGGSLPRKTSVNSVSYVENNPKKKETDPDKGKNISSPDNKKKYIQVKKVQNGKTIGGVPDVPKKKSTGAKKKTNAKPKTVKKPKIPINSKPVNANPVSSNPPVGQNKPKSKPSLDTLTSTFGVSADVLKSWLGL